MKRVKLVCIISLQNGTNRRSVNDEIIISPEVLSSFRGSGREDVFSSWVSTNKPGYIYVRNSGGIQELENISLDESSKSSSKNIKPFINVKGKNDLNCKKEAEKTKRFIFSKNEKTRKIKELRESYANKSKTPFYFLNLLWLQLDTTWKKVLFIFLVLWLLSGVYDFIHSKLFYSEDYQIYVEEKQRVLIVESKIDSLIRINQKNTIPILLEKLHFNKSIDNMFLQDSISDLKNKLYQKRQNLSKMTILN